MERLLVKLVCGCAKKAIGRTEVIEGRPADLLPHELKQLRREIGALAKMMRMF